MEAFPHGIRLELAHEILEHQIRARNNTPPPAICER